METIKLELPLPPNPNSSRQRKAHWAVRYKDKKKYYVAAYVAMREQGIKFPDEPWKRARVDCRFYVWNLLDEDDNLPVRRKAILDFLTCDRTRLVARGFLTPKKTRPLAGTGFFEDDSRRTLDRGRLSQRIDRSPGGLRVVVTIRRLE